MQTKFQHTEVWTCESGWASGSVDWVFIMLCVAHEVYVFYILFCGFIYTSSATCVPYVTCKVCEILQFIYYIYKYIYISMCVCLILSSKYHILTGNA